MMSNGNYAEYLSGQLQNMNERLLSLSDAADKAQKSYEKQRSKLQAQLDDMVLNSSEEAKPLVRMLKELSDLQHEALSDPNKNGEVREKSNQIDSYISDLKSKSGDKKTLELVKSANQMLTSLRSLNGSGQNMKKTVAQVRSEQFKNFKELISKVGDYKNDLKYMAWGTAKDRNTAQSNLSSANLNVGRVARLLDEARQQNSEIYRQDLKGIETERSEMLKKLDEQFANPKSKMTQEEYSLQRSIIENKSNQATAEATLKYQQAQVDAAKREYDVKMKIVNLAERGVDIQLDVAQSIGAPMETIVALERQRVQLAEDAYNAAHKQYQDLVNSGATQEEIEEAKLKMQKAQADVIKNQVGAQRSMMEKVFGNMIGSFGENAGIMGPNNLARKYGYGYGQGKDGTVTKGGKSTGGYRSRIFANNAMGNVTTVGLPQREGIGSSGAASAPGNGTSTGGQQPPAPKPGSGSPGVTGAGDKTKSDSEFSKLGEKFASEKEGIEAAVFWEKKIYNVLVQDLVPGIKGIRGGGSGFGTIDATYRTYRDPRARNPKIDPNASKNNGSNGNSGIGIGNGFTNTGNKSSAKPNEKGDPKNGNVIPQTGGTPNKISEPLPTVSVKDVTETTPGSKCKLKIEPVTPPSKKQEKLDNKPSSKLKPKYKLKKGVKLGKDEWFDEQTGIVYHDVNQIEKTLNKDGTFDIKSKGGKGVDRTLADGSRETIVGLGSKRTIRLPGSSSKKRKLTEEVIEPTQKATLPVSPIQAGSQKKNWSQVTWAHEMIQDYKQASPERKKKLLEDLKARYQQFNIANVKDGKLAETARYHIDSANEAFGNASGWFGRYKELSDMDFAHAAMATNRLTNMLPVPAPAETSATAGTKPASTGTAPQGNNGGGKTTIEVQVKFNSQMFEEQVKRITMANAREITRTGSGAPE